MGVTTKKINFSSLADYESLRLVYSKNRQTTRYPLEKLLDYIDSLETGKRPAGGIIYLENTQYAFSLGGEQILSDGSIDLENPPMIPMSFYEKTNRGKILNNDILICKDGALTGKTGIISNNYSVKNVMVNEHVYVIRSNDRINQKILYYLIRSNFVHSQIVDLAFRKKGQPGLNNEHLKGIKIPSLPKDIEKNLLKAIEPIEKSIDVLKEKVKPSKEIINEFFTQELKFDWTKFYELESKKTFLSSLMDFSKNKDNRYSFKFHNKAGKYLHDFLLSKTNKKVKDFLSEPIVLGKSIAPKDYDENGEYFYISMANIKNWEFEEEDSSTVSLEYSSLNLNKSIKQDDIILARSGEGTIGKVALIEDRNIKAITSDFTQRIRLTNYNNRLAYYFFRSDFFQYLVYTHKKGLGNNTNIFPSQIEEFPLPDWSDLKQTDIANRIKLELDTQKEIREQIIEKQNQINLIINEAL